MTSLAGIPLQAVLGQVVVGLINGSFYALLSLGVAVVFGMLHVINFAHGALYMMGAFSAWFILVYLGIGYWLALILAPAIVAVFGMILERTMFARLYRLDHIYGLLLSFGIAMVVEGMFQHWYGTSGQRYPAPSELGGAVNLGFLILPRYRVWVIVASLFVCFGTWYLIERTRLGAYMRATVENPTLVQLFGVNVPRLMTLTYGLGAGLAAFAGVLAAPIYQVSPLMGQHFIIIAFAIVVIGGMGSILGAILTSYALGIVEGLTKLFYPEASSTVIFLVMAIILLVRPTGLLGKG